jgi:DNA-binding HxlR family transcriptional regulator
MNKLQEEILKFFWENQCDTDDGVMLTDEFTPLISYKKMEKEFEFVGKKVEKELLKPQLCDLRNKGLIYLAMAVDYDYIPHGSGWSLTEKGVDLCNEMFLSKELNKKI